MLRQHSAPGAGRPTRGCTGCGLGRATLTRTFCASPAPVNRRSVSRLTSMCVSLTLSPVTKQTKLDADELASVSGLLVTRKTAGAFELCPSNGCPCDFVGGGRPTDAGWTVRADQRGPLTLAVKLAAERLRRFRLSVSWLDEPVASELIVTLDEMVEIIQTGQVGRRAFLVAAG
jgi:hypothetical protein